MNKTTEKLNIEDPNRLPNTVRPTHYDIALEPNFETFSFRGKIAIKVDILQETAEIILHAKELEIKFALLEIAGKTLFPEIVLDEGKQTAKFVFKETLQKGHARLVINFVGTLNDQMVGFYRSFYEVSGKKEIMATTQFEDTDARRAFPCWDEPAIKAKFKISLIVPQDLEVLSNTLPEYSEKLNNGKKIVKFVETPLMSTYLVAFVIGKLKSIEARTKNGTLVRVFATQGKEQNGQFALECGVRCLEFYEEYFNYAYPLPKLDMVAIPDFASGAMENWGLVTYRETAILYNAKRSPLVRKQRVAIVVAHELAHQWFGNLVTMEWWTQLWLNEGFASWMEYLVVDDMFPMWNIWDQFISDDFMEALADDGLRSTHAVEMVINNPSELRQSFDSISYQKGACIIRMIHDYIGAEDFRKGLQMYIEEHAYGNTTTEDLWASLEKSSKKPIRKIMDTWTKQPGYPVLQVNTDGNDALCIFQERFLSNGDPLLPEEKDQKWEVPISYLDASDQRLSVLIPVCDEAKIYFPNLSECAKLNIGQTALVRILYPQSWINVFYDAVKNKTLPPADRLGLVEDLYSFAKAGKISVTMFMDFLMAYADEDNPEVWQNILSSLSGLAKIASRDSLEIFNEYARSILSKIVQKKGWDEDESETHTHKMLRGQLLHAYSVFGDKCTLDEGIKRFSLFLDNVNAINPNLRPSICCIAAHAGDEKTHQDIVACYQKAPAQEEKVELLTALGNFSSRDMLRKSLDFALTEAVRLQDIGFIFYSVSGNHAHGDLAWEFLEEKWGQIYPRLNGALNILSYMIEYSVGSFRSEEQISKARAFFEKNSVPEASMAIARAMEFAKARVTWIAREEKQIEEWLKNWKSKNNS